MRAIRVIVFVVFFGVGAAVLSITVLCDDLLDYYHNKNLLNQAEAYLKKLETLDSDYDTLLGQIENDPCQLARLAPATLGIEPNEPNTVYPRGAPDKLAAARQALSVEPDLPQVEQEAPQWLVSWSQWPYRHIFFIAGSALVLISFIFFGPAKRLSHKMSVTSKNESAESPQAE
jgi:hypothetical protein